MATVLGSGVTDRTTPGVGNRGSGAPTSSATSAGKVDPMALIKEAEQGLAGTSANIDVVLSRLQAKGVYAARATHAGELPSDDKIVLSDGTVVDLIGGNPGDPFGALVIGPGAYGNRPVIVNGKVVKFNDWQSTVPTGSATWDPIANGAPGPWGGGKGPATPGQDQPPGTPPPGAPPAPKGPKAPDQPGDPPDLPPKGPKQREPDPPGEGNGPPPAPVPQPNPTPATSPNTMNLYSAAYQAALRARRRSSGSGRSSTVMAGFGGGGAPSTQTATLLGR
jgi:hypothetical protein